MEKIRVYSDISGWHTNYYEVKKPFEFVEGKSEISHKTTELLKKFKEFDELEKDNEQYNKLVNSLMDLGYSEEISKQIVFAYMQTLEDKMFEKVK